MKRKNIEKVVKSMIKLGYISDANIESFIDELDENINANPLTSNNEDDEMEEFKWENCIEGVGYYYDNLTNKLEILDKIIGGSENTIEVANSESIIESNIAACKLSWIITKINKKYNQKGQDIGYLGYNESLEQPYLSKINTNSLPKLNNYHVFDTLVKTNLPLIRQYFGIKE